jgi:protein TonB
MLIQNVFLLEEMNGAEPQGAVVLPPPKKMPQQDVFAEAMLERTSTRQKRHPLKWAASLGAHMGVLILLLLMPLYFSQGLNLQKMNMTFLVAPLPPAAAPPPLPPAAAPRAVRTVLKTFTPGKLTAPSFVPKAVAVASAPDAALPEEALAGMSGGVPGGLPGWQVGGVLGGVMKEVAAPMAPATMPEGPRRPVRIGGEVKPPRLLFGPAPIYPILAMQSQVHGIVVIEAIIDEHGNVIEEKVITGHPLLIQAALKAVSQRKYEPTILDGAPTPVALRVEITFHMN